MKQNYEEPRMREYQVQIRRCICDVSNVNVGNDTVGDPFSGNTEEEW